MQAIVCLLPAFLLVSQPRESTCVDVAACRQAALDAEARKDFETFHDFAWRAVQKARPNDPELMSLLARAQSLSGRPGDALVMLRRLAEMGFTTDAIESEDFRRVRALAGWPAVETLIVAAKNQRTAVPDASPTIALPAERGGAIAARESPLAGSRPGRVKGSDNALASPAGTAGGEEALRLPPWTVEAIGLAYDSASRRFVVGDRHDNKLIVADEVFKRVNDLIRADSGGFGTLTALEIDGRRGDLWVASAGEEGGASVHKLQLVSGRVISKTELPDDMRPARFNDIAVTDSGGLLLVDAAGSRLLILAPGARSITRLAASGITTPSSVASAAGVAYVAHDGGLAAVDLRTGTAATVHPAAGVVLTGLRRIRSHRGALVAIQADGETARVVRIRLARSGRAATAVEAIDDQIPEKGSALTVSGDVAYYLTGADNGPVIRRVPLK